MMKPDPMPQPVLMNTVALRAVSIALRAGKVFASWASRPRSACAAGPAENGAGGARPPTEPRLSPLVARPAGAARERRLMLGEFREIDPARCAFDRVSLLMSALRTVHLEAYTASPAGRLGARSQFCARRSPGLGPKRPDRQRGPFIMRHRTQGPRRQELPLTSRASQRAGRLRVLRVEPPRPP